MAIRYVYSGATGSANGTSWTDAYTTLASTTAAAPGDEIRIHKDHTESPSASISFSTGSAARLNPVRICVVDKDNGDAPATGATISPSSSFTINGAIICERLTIINNPAINMPIGSSGQYYIDCSFIRSGSGTAALTFGSSSPTILLNCTIDATGCTNNPETFSVGSRVVMMGGSIVNRAGSPAMVENSRSIFIAEGVDIINDVTSLVRAGSGALSNTFRNCRFVNFTNMVTSTSVLTTGATLERCVVGEISAPSMGLTIDYTVNGTTISDLTRYRTGGANDGYQANEHSWAMTRTGMVYFSPPIVRWTSSGSKTVTIYLAAGEALTNHDFWVTVFSPSESTPPTSQATHRSTKGQYGVAAANLDSDGDSTWNGTGVSVPQKISVEISPTIDGPVTVYCHSTKSATIYIDPLIEIT